ncbi:Carcinoembryonic antigen-related cell adhesion molecule 1 [Myotis davidii]|uniref:Carcinoembryonic antigen-related cell adhesion molecule 1 n=1 Tax=Myotis davidii TaxID=225400 RepID=L5M7N5_MYODS|nr:Carcinoembryonic antigen-related cell adhesion molecule 1 [Myotis davidii]
MSERLEWQVISRSTNPQPASNQSRGHSDNSPNKIPEVTYPLLNFSGQESKKPKSASPSPIATEPVYS